VVKMLGNNLWEVRSRRRVALGSTRLGSLHYYRKPLLETNGLLVPMSLWQLIILTTGSRLLYIACLVENAI
jgi:hypothetical protein